MISMSNHKTHHLPCKESLEKTFGVKYEKNIMYFIVVQGPTAAGKTTLSQDIFYILKNINCCNDSSPKNIKPFLLSLDDFYDFPYNNNSKDDFSVDYDNPNMLNWSNIYNVINSLIEEKTYITIYKRPNGLVKDISYVKNPGFNVIIIEGVYAFNCLNEVVFNILEFDGHNIEKNIKQEYTKNTNIKKGKKKLKIFNLLLTQCKERLYKLRIQKDIILKYAEKEDIVKRLDTYTWPATLRWVYSPVFKHDYKIKNGNFNRKKVEELKSNIKYFFEK
ncbi:uridine kinase [Vairimorpha necatrix]|uniref:Uridine kinase n=1 Tax=Vairimorpha necatrix TaxID=6039 RepID=A0AAX4JAD3_9MICR